MTHWLMLIAPVAAVVCAEGQGVHMVGSSAAPRYELKSQGVHAELPFAAEMEPAGHLEHDVDPERGEKVPAKQATHTEMLVANGTLLT